MTNMQHDNDDYCLPSEAAASQDQEQRIESRILRYAQLGLRLIGIMFVFEGIAGVCGSVVYMIVYFVALERGGYESSMPDAHSCGWFASSFVTLVCGYYFISDGRRLIELVFLSPSSTESNANASQGINDRTDPCN